MRVLGAVALFSSLKNTTSPPSSQTLVVVFTKVSEGGTSASCECLLLTLRVHVLGQLESVRVGQVGVGWSDGQDQAALPGDELHDHVPDLLLDVGRLVAHGHLGDPRQVDERQVQHCSR